jgi:hypothetical protein
LDEPSSVERLWEEFKGAIIDELRAIDWIPRSVGSEQGDRLSLVDTLEDKGAEDRWPSSSPRR